MLFKEKNTSNKSRKRDYNEMEEDSDVSEDYCAAPKCTEPTGMFFFVKF